MSSASAPGELRPSGIPWARLEASADTLLAQSLSRGLAGGASIALGTPGQRPIADAEPLGSFGGRRLPRGLAIASDGRLYLADPAGRRVLTALASDGASPRPPDASPEWPFIPLWPARPLPPAPQAHDLGSAPNPPADPYTLVRPLALALAPNGDLVIADAGRNGAGRLLVLTLPDGRLRHVIPIAEPVAVSFDSWGRACVADAGSGSLLRFDRSWRRELGYPHASVPALEGLLHLAHTASTRCGCAESCGCSGACSCQTTCDCRAVATALPDLWVITTRGVHALTRDGFLWSQGERAFAGSAQVPVAALPQDARLVPPALDLASDGALSWRDPALPAHDPLLLPGLSVDRGGRLVGTRFPLLARPRNIELPRSGVAQLLALDGGREGFAWDRVALVADVPERTRLLVATATTDAKLEEAQIANLPDSAWSAPLGIGAGEPPELLVQSPGGRYLWLRIEMFGDGHRTPHIRSIDVFAPRRSSLADLPAPFREDPKSASFLDRFLSYFDTVFAEVAARHASVPELFEPAAVPAGPFLQWLASWFDLTFLPEWPEATRRAMVSQAVALYRRRGTVAGLRQMLQWHTGVGAPFPAIIEHFRVKSPISVAGSTLSPTSPEHTFTIVLPALVAPNADAMNRLHSVIIAVIPAHTRYDLRLLEPGISIGRQSTPGVDMLLGSSRPEPLGGARLGDDAIFEPGRSPLALVNGQGEPCSC